MRLVLINLFLLAFFLTGALAESRVPKVEDIVEIKVDGACRNVFNDKYWAHLKIGSEDVKRVLSTYSQVSEYDWFHNFSHVSGGDRCGSMTLKNGANIQWMIRPGGLARLTFVNGERIFLVAAPPNR